MEKEREEWEKEQINKVSIWETQWEMNWQPKSDVTAMGVGFWQVGQWDMVSYESATSFQGCTLNMTMFVGAAVTTLYTQVVREGPLAAWGSAVLERAGQVLWCCL